MNQPAAPLERYLRFRDLVALAFGAMVGWGWVVLSGDWLQSAGLAGTLLAFAAGTAIMALIALTYAELAAAMPVTGGEHAYALRAFGRHGAFVCTWAIVFGYVTVAAFEAVALPTVVSGIWPLAGPRLWQVAGWDVHLHWVLVGIAGSAVVTVINVIGVRPAAFLQVALVSALLAAGLLVLFGALLQPGADRYSDHLSLPLQGAALTGAGFASVLVMVPFLFVGFDVIPQSAGETRSPSGRLGSALLLAVAMTGLWYMIIVWAVARGFTSAAAQSSVPTAEAAAVLWHAPWARQAVLLAGLCGILSSWNGFVVGGSRALYAMAQDGMLPAALAVVHPRFRTPHRAIMLIGALAALAPWFGRPLLVWLVNAGGLGVVIAYLLVAAAFLQLRRTEPEMSRPYRVTAGTLVGWLALLSATALIFLYLPGSSAALERPEWLLIGGWVALGLLLYWPRRARQHGSGLKPGIAR